MDTLNAGVHFPDDTAPADIGWKALAVNLSDLAAMGAQPAWCTLSLSLPQADAGWVDALPRRLPRARATSMASRWSAATPRAGRCRSASPRTASSMPGRALRRDGARVGDDIWVTGTLGDAAAALAQWRASASERRCDACARAWIGRRRASPPASRWRHRAAPASTCPTACSPTSAMSAPQRRRRAKSTRRVAGIAGAACRVSIATRGVACRQRRRRLRAVLHRRAQRSRTNRRDRRRDRQYGSPASDASWPGTCVVCAAISPTALRRYAAAHRLRTLRCATSASCEPAAAPCRD